MDIRRGSLLLSVVCCGCGWVAGPQAETRGLNTAGVQLIRAEHAVSVPLQAFASLDASVTTRDAAACAPGSASAFTHVAVELAPDAVYVGGEPLAVLMDGGAFVPAERRGLLIDRLYERLLGLHEVIEDDRKRGCAPWRSPDEPEQDVPFGRLLLSVDARVPWSTVEPVVFTALHAQFDDLFLRVEDGPPAPWAFAPPGEPAAVLQPSATALSAQVVHEIDTQAGAAGPGAVVGIAPIEDPEVVGANGSTSGGARLAADARVSVLRVRLTDAWTTAGRPKKAAPRGAGAAGEPPTEPIPADIARALERELDAVKSCYAAVEPPSMWVYFMVLPDGAVSNVKVTSSDLGNPVVDCVRTRFEGLRFSKRTEAALVSLPLPPRP